MSTAAAVKLDEAQLSQRGLYSLGAKWGLGFRVRRVVRLESWSILACGFILMSHLPHRVGGVTWAVLVTDEAIETLGTEALLAVRPFEPRVTQAGAVDVVALGSVLTVTPLVTLRSVGAHRALVLAPGREAPSNKRRLLKWPCKEAKTNKINKRMKNVIRWPSVKLTVY